MALIEMSSIYSSENMIRSMEEEETICTDEDALMCLPINTSLSGSTSIRPEPEAQTDSESASNVSESGYISERQNGSRQGTACFLNMSTTPLPLSTTPLQVFLTNLIWYRMHRDDHVQSNEVLRKQKRKRVIFITVGVISCLILTVIGVTSFLLLLSRAEEIETPCKINNDNKSQLFSLDPLKFLNLGNSSNNIESQNPSISTYLMNILRNSGGANRTSPDHQ